MSSFWGPIISSYSRAQAIEDGVLVALPEAICREAGFTFPLAMTRDCYAAVVEWDGTPDQSENGRLWDVLWMLHATIKGTLPAVHHPATAGSESDMLFALAVKERPGHPVPSLPLYRYPTRETVVLKAMVGPGDNREPVMTIMFWNED